MIIKLLIMDVDGVLTDGRLYYTDAGESMKVFHVLDGVGIKALHEAGIQTAIITGRQSNILQKRAQELGITYCYQKQENKQPAYDDCLQQCQLQPEQVAYIGDDIPDLPLIQKSGLGIAVATAHASVKPHADYVTTLGGGLGAVREACDLILAEYHRV